MFAEKLEAGGTQLLLCPVSNAPLLRTRAIRSSDAGRYSMAAMPRSSCRPSALAADENDVHGGAAPGWTGV